MLLGNADDDDDDDDNDDVAADGGAKDFVVPMMNPNSEVKIRWLFMVLLYDSLSLSADEYVVIELATNKSGQHGGVGLRMRCDER